ncbi:KAP-like P-loop domain-containing protein [Arthrobacter sp. 9V]|uniref:KAP family NTPase n=1 Tax=Arthrobacter sp. 9V TaxID=2653132 RepID=UPI0012F29500|nr:KAP family NTPase [Arthrobacter sp. 9V]VXB67388.1 KAP-like P-loop domain-containing protein [Arthrobacter sp. 9V]
MTHTVWTDEALSTAKQDDLGRLPYAQRAAELIQATHSFESSAVFGLTGAWGSGKTSLVNLIVEELQKKHPEWGVARFTPWATSDVPGLLNEFHSSLSSALPKKKGKQVRQALATTAAVAAPAAKLIPIAGDVAAAGVKLAADALAKSPSWQAAFNKASAELKELQKPILIVVDDIDRLHGDELLALLKVVRLLGRFDGVQYLLAYDDETLYRSMDVSRAVTSHDGSAERFMEKIVQYPLFVPTLLRHQQISRLRKGLTGISRQTVDDGSASERLGGLIECFTRLLTTPRAIDRYIAQLQHHIPLLPIDEVDDEDVQLLTLIRVSFPSLFNSIPQYRSELISGHTGEWTINGQSLEYEPFDIEPLLAVVPETLRGTARDLLVSLFPKVAKKGQLAVHGSHRRQSVQHEEYFDRYFAMGILDHDVSDATVHAAVKEATEGAATPLRDLLVGAESEIRNLVLSKCLNPTSQPTTDEGRIQLAEVLAEIANDFPEDNSGPFGDRDQLLIWIGDVLAGLDEGTPAENLRAVMWTFDTPALRIRAWRRLEYSIDRAYRSGKPSWYDAVTTMLVEDAMADFLDHLKQGDDASTKSGIGYQVHFVLSHSQEQLRSAIHQLLESKEADVSTLASRLVSAQTIVGTKPNWQLSDDFDQETFNRLAPPTNDPWYDEPKQEVDIRDLSWANRRKFAAGRVRPPSGIVDHDDPKDSDSE